jgi:hypothetical protein
MPNPSEPDLSDEQHFSSLSAFVKLLRQMGFKVRRQRSGKLEVRLAASAHPFEGFLLADCVHLAEEHGLFNCRVFGTARANAPLVVSLWLEELKKPGEPPLHKRVEVPEDYFDLAEALDRVVLQFDFDSPAGIEFTSQLMYASEAFIDYEGDYGNVEALEATLEAVRPEDLERWRAMRYGASGLRFWLDHFDLAFHSALDLKDEWLIVQCVGPPDRGYVGDRMLFLLEREAFEELRVPITYRTAVN